VQGGNDQAFLDFGGMPMPFALNATAIGKTSLVQLTWDPVEDPQHMIAGYRIRCHDGDGVWRHLGSSFVAGFLDVTAPIDSARHYQVTSYSKNAIESAPSDEAVTVIEPPSDRLFANGFEWTCRCICESPQMVGATCRPAPVCHGTNVYNALRNATRSRFFARYLGRSRGRSCHFIEAGAAMIGASTSVCRQADQVVLMSRTRTL
jgi:hypothetical protein